jgi:hypothetical protein
MKVHSLFLHKTYLTHWPYGVSLSNPENSAISLDRLPEGTRLTSTITTNYIVRRRTTVQICVTRKEIPREILQKSLTFSWGTDVEMMASCLEQLADVGRWNSSDRTFTWPTTFLDIPSS